MRAGARRLGALVAVTVIGLAACGGHHTASRAPSRPRISIPAPVSHDVWNPPSLAGGPSAGTFCAGLIADYRHTQQNAIATTVQVKEEILTDFVQYTPRLVAVAPAAIQGPASTYLGGEVQVIRILLAADLQASRAPAGSIGDLLESPTIRAAGVAFGAWSEQTCHFDITSDGT